MSASVRLVDDRKCLAGGRRRLQSRSDRGQVGPAGLGPGRVRARSDDRTDRTKIVLPLGEHVGSDQPAVNHANRRKQRVDRNTGSVKAPQHTRSG